MKHDSLVRELDIDRLLDELIHLHLIHLASMKSGLDINRLLYVLQEIKRKCEFKPGCKLTRFENRYFCLLLRGYSGREIAFIYDENRVPTREELVEHKHKLEARIKNLRKEASKGLNKYLKCLLDLDEIAYIPRTSKLIQILKNKGYGIENPSKSKTKSTLFIKGEISAEEITEILQRVKPNLNLEVKQILPEKSKIRF